MDWPIIAGPPPDTDPKAFGCTHTRRPWYRASLAPLRSYRFPLNPPAPATSRAFFVRLPDRSETHVPELHRTDTPSASGHPPAMRWAPRRVLILAPIAVRLP